MFHKVIITITLRHRFRRNFCYPRAARMHPFLPPPPYSTLRDRRECPLSPGVASRIYEIITNHPSAKMLFLKKARSGNLGTERTTEYPVWTYLAPVELF